MGSGVAGQPHAQPCSFRLRCVGRRSSTSASGRGHRHRRHLPLRPLRRRRRTPRVRSGQARAAALTKGIARAMHAMASARPRSRQAGSPPALSTARTPQRSLPLPLGEVTPPEEVAEVISFLATGRSRHRSHDRRHRRRIRALSDETWQGEAGRFGRTTANAPARRQEAAGCILSQ
jgi:hypothetical protein